MPIKELPAQFTLPERHGQLTPMRVSIVGYVEFSRRLLASLDELERAHPAPARQTTRPDRGRGVSRR